mmetsp:Transcript_5834/g.16928  ORF Transcript_5834/g.16928 Transcript_5834/m.16928 type:complete len:232 (+) Transcript_5834:1148-1843(+)
MASKGAPLSSPHPRQWPAAHSGSRVVVSQSGAWRSRSAAAQALPRATSPPPCWGPAPWPRPSQARPPLPPCALLAPAMAPRRLQRRARGVLLCEESALHPWCHPGAGNWPDPAPSPVWLPPVPTRAPPPVRPAPGAVLTLAPLLRAMPLAPEARPAEAGAPRPATLRSLPLGVLLPSWLRRPTRWRPSLQWPWPQTLLPRQVSRQSAPPPCLELGTGRKSQGAKSWSGQAN